MTCSGCGNETGAGVETRRFDYSVWHYVLKLLCPSCYETEKAKHGQHMEKL